MIAGPGNIARLMAARRAAVVGASNSKSIPLVARGSGVVALDALIKVSA